MNSPQSSQKRGRSKMEDNLFLSFIVYRSQRTASFIFYCGIILVLMRGVVTIAFGDALSGIFFSVFFLAYQLVFSGSILSRFFFRISGFAYGYFFFVRFFINYCIPCYNNKIFIINVGLGCICF